MDDPRFSHEHAAALRGTVWQDQLLGAYRLLTTVTCVGVLTAGAAAAVVASVTDGAPSWAAAVAAVVAAVLITGVVRRMREVTANRALDVNWWQRRVMEIEEQMDSKILTDFKQAQHERSSLKPVAQASGSRLDDLLRKGRRHVRGAVEKAVFRSLIAAGWLVGITAVAAAIS